ncbi:cyclic nucleotide-binding domain-containing protein [Anaerosporobacter faecicola]|uniref:cyclic nucleotide-binding domain-containing protein n=1 Tax=Anaerosporobacter faecicola TaxID=2718714 RepID=UPI00143B1FD0|nr:cyclic nucleotide-binding domain-containing protein [Anaerosporobacter faecicola]
MIQIQDNAIIETYVKKYAIDKILTMERRYELQLCQFRQGEFVCRAGDELRYLYFFLVGKAKVYTMMETGKSLLFSFYDTFDLIGDVEFILGTPIQCNVECMTQVYCLRISLLNYREELLQDNRLLRGISNHLASKLSGISNNSARNLLYPLENRLAAYILSMEKEDIFSENLVQTAELLGTSYRHLLRCIKKFCEYGYMKKEGKGYSIIEQKKLLELGERVYK